MLVYRLLVFSAAVAFAIATASATVAVAVDAILQRLFSFNLIHHVVVRAVVRMGYALRLYVVLVLQ